MTDLRKAAQQALEALEWHYRQGHSNTLGGLRLKIDEKALRNLRAALAQQAEPKGGGRLPPPLRAEPDLSLCPQCNGPADNGHDRSIPPSPYLCTKCMAEMYMKLAPNFPVAEAKKETLKNARAIERAHGIKE